MVAPVVEVRKGEDVVALSRDKDSRKDNCYIVNDVMGGAVLCTQRLPAAASFLNAHVCPMDTVNVASL